MNDNKQPVKVILDTDMGGDCDDVGALAVLHALCDRGEAQILAVTHCYAGQAYGGCIASVNAYCGRPDIPVGIQPETAREVHRGVDSYASALSQEFPHKFHNGAAAEDSLRVMRRALSSCEGRATIVAIGSMYTLSGLLESPADDLSPLTGEALVAQKVERAVIMGGRFHETWPAVYQTGDIVVDAEFNIIADIKAAQTLCRRWPVELVMCSYEIGWDIVTGRDEIYGGSVNPMRRAYQIVTGGKGRESWDLATVLYAVRPDAQDWTRHPYGRITVDDQGVTKWTPCQNGQHTYLLVRRPPDEIRDELDSLLKAVVARHDGAEAET